MYGPEQGTVGQENYKEIEVTLLKKRTHRTACIGGGVGCAGRGALNTWKAGEQGSSLNIYKPSDRDWT